VTVEHDLGARHLRRSYHHRPVGDDAQLLARLRAGDEAAFVTLVDQYHASMVRLASTFVPNRAVAEEVVQDAWVGVLRGLETFEGRATLRTWLFRILVNRARSTGVREHRSVPTSLEEPAVDPRRFASDGHWVEPPVPWTEEVENRLAAADTVDRIRTIVEELPGLQRQVITLRDMEGLPAAEVCDILGISEGNQRVLLHRARSHVRRILAEELGKD
jgi:RNA polymerase sigma-70 factor (ECF subfamily)